MKKIDTKQVFETKITNFEKVNPFFSKVKIYVMFEGIANGSYFSKDVIERATKTAYNVPVVGEFLKDTRNFGGHGISVEIDDEGEIEFVSTTFPYGVIPESAEIYWEAVTEENGSSRNYLVIDGAYLWSGRYPELNTLFDENYFGQSMEIQVMEGSFAIREGQEVLQVDEFVFSAFCLLGINKESDPDGEVTPAFSSAKVVAYSLDKESFKMQFNQMLEELKFTLIEGGQNQMEDIQKDLETFETETELNLEYIETVEEVENQIEDTVETDIQFEIEVDEKKKIESNPVATIIIEEEVVDESENLSTNEDAEENSEGETFSITEEEYNTLKSNFETLEIEVTELKQYKRNRELGDLKEKFSTQLTEQELDSLFSEKSDADLAVLETEIFALIGKKNYSFQPNKQKPNKVEIVSPKSSVEDDKPYGDIFN